MLPSKITRKRLLIQNVLLYYIVYSFSSMTLRRNRLLLFVNPEKEVPKCLTRIPHFHWFVVLTDGVRV